MFDDTFDRFASDIAALIIGVILAAIIWGGGKKMPDSEGTRFVAGEEEKLYCGHPLADLGYLCTICHKNLEKALEESLKLQNHYAGLLNDSDGGERMQFESAKVWLARLKETGILEKTE